MTATVADIDRKTALDLYRVMRSVRAFEERASALFGENKIWGTIHSYAGEEAIAAGVCAHLRDQDWITEKAKRILNVPLSWTFLGTFTFGYAAEAPVVDRLPLDQLVSVDRFPGRPRP